MKLIIETGIPYFLGLVLGILLGVQIGVSTLKSEREEICTQVAGEDSKMVDKNCYKITTTGLEKVW